MSGLVSRVLAWLRRNPAARADALELAATSLRSRADAAPPARAERMRRRAALYEQRAQLLRAP